MSKTTTELCRTCGKPQVQGSMKDGKYQFWCLTCHWNGPRNGIRQLSTGYRKYYSQPQTNVSLEEK